MIDEQFARDQIRRLSQLEGFPRDTPALKELVLALQACKSNAQAYRVISDVLELAVAGSRCPYPADLRRLSYERAQADELTHREIPAEPKVSCPICGDSGVTETAPGIDSIANWCTCSSAQSRRAAEPKFVDDVNSSRQILTRFGKRSIGELVGTVAEAKKLTPEPVRAADSELNHTEKALENQDIEARVAALEQSAPQEKSRR